MSNNVAALYEVRCCCHPENLLGFLPKKYERIFRRRELSDGTWALDSQHQEEKIRKLPEFVPVEFVNNEIASRRLTSVGGKTWKKTWKK